MDVTNTGATGASGVDGASPSGSGGNGAPGQDISAIVNNATDNNNSATANGGRGGNGGIGAPGSPLGVGIGGNGGNGAQGGNATASATTTTAATGLTEAIAAAGGGTGGEGAQGGQLDGLGGSGADGGSAEGTSAVDFNTTGSAFAIATDSGGTGGDSSQDTQAGSLQTYQGRVFPGGNGGAVGNTTASATGLTAATANVVENGGGGGSGTQGGIGAGSSITDAVTGSTTDGVLQLEQESNGGAGGDGSEGPGGQGGAAAADLIFDDTASPTRSAMVEVENRAAAGAAGSGGIGSVAGVNASANTTITGAHDVAITESANGGAGGAAGASDTLNAGGDGGSGGNASGSASGTTTSVTGRVSVNLTVVGGVGGAAEDGAYIEAIPAAGGDGGQASIGSVSGTGGASADVEATLAGGNGGSSDGALGGTGAGATLINAVTGSTQGGTLTLDETATAGAGGDSFGGTGGQGGDATTVLTFDDTANATQSATFFVDVEAAAGQGGFDQIGANPGPNQVGTSRQSSGDGGAAVATGAITAAAALPSGRPTTVYLTVMATGGSGLDGGDATANATATGGTVNVQSYATATGGLEHGNTALDHAGTATADATGTDAGGFVTAQATSNLNSQVGNDVSVVSGTATAVVAGTSTAHAVAGFNQQGSFDTSGQAVADVIGLPSAPMTGTDVAAGQTLLFDADQGSSGVPGATGSHTTTTTINATVDLTPFNRGSEFLLDLHQATVFGRGVTGVTFDVTDIATPIHKVFTDAASAAGYFTDDLLDLGSFDAVTGDSSTLFVQMSLAVTTDDASSGFFAEIEGAGTVACYCPGTRILTVRGEVIVEDLAIGDLVVTASGSHRPIRWLGHRSLDCRNHPRPEQAHPIRIARDALGEHKPAQDLYVSPAHSLCIDVLGEVLIPACSLANGSTITQVDVDQVTYWHVELDSHDILIANGLPAESYIDMGNRRFFVESDIVDFEMSPDGDLAAERTHADFCRPLVVDGPIVDAVRLQLRRRAEMLGWTLDASQRFGDLHLVVGGIRIDPVVRGLTARFTMPAAVEDTWLVSTTARPCDVTESDDRRQLGVCLTGLTIDEGFGDRSIIALDDPLLGVGVYGIENSRRWTAGRAHLPAGLWDKCPDEFFLLVEIVGPALPRWAKPVDLTAAARKDVRAI